MENINVNGGPGRGPGADPKSGRVALFVTCLVDLFRPRAGFSAVRLLERAGYVVAVPDQGCCGQPNFNSGDRSGAAEIAAGMIRRFSGYGHVVVPSGSCAAMIRCHYPALFADGSADHAAARALADKTSELTVFLHDVAGLRGVAADRDAHGPAPVAYHDGCSGLRELGIRRQPRRLLQSVAGLDVRELRDPEACCGFGGLFCVKYPDISNRIAASKTRDIAATGAKYFVTGELGCLLQIEGKLHRDGSPIRGLHVAEVLAGALDAGGAEAMGAGDASAPAAGGSDADD